MLETIPCRYQIIWSLHVKNSSQEDAMSGDQLEVGIMSLKTTIGITPDMFRTYAMQLHNMNFILAGFQERRNTAY
eukprot:3959977-Karenia_brevis.AAC.1